MKLSEKQVQEFMEQLYKNSDKELKKLFKHQNEIKGKILEEVANIMLIYIIENDVMKMTKAEQKREMQKLSNLINTYISADATMQISIISSLLATTVNDTFKFYSYNAKKKEVEKIINAHYKGKHFSERVWSNEKEVTKYMNKQMKDFLDGKISVNKIKKNVESTFNSSAYEAERLTETEVARCANNAFDRFCIEVGVEKVKYNARLEACEKCKPYDGKIYDFNDKPDLPKHPLCRCYFDIIE